MTIYALSSGPGTSGIAVIRVSGKNTAEVIKKLTGSKLPPPRVATLKKFNKNGGKELIDEGVIIWFPGPNSYTGEDMAEFHVHGSIAVIKAVQNSISQIKNCRLAEPGEFTKIAFQNNKINLIKAESIRPALQRVSILANEKFKGVRIDLEDNKLTVSSENPEQEKARETIEIENTGKSLSVGFNVSYLIDAISACDGELVNLGLNDENSSALITDPTDPESKFVVMPMRL